MVCGWPVEALVGSFLEGLKDEVMIKVQAVCPALREALEAARLAEEKNKAMGILRKR